MNTANMEPLPDFDLEGEELVTARDTRIEQLLDAWQLSYELEPNCVLSKVKLNEGVQIRLEEHRAPSTAVDEYVTHMKHGAVFPPIVVTSNGFLVDGNTRLKACAKLERKTFPAYKVKFAILGQAKMFGAALNQMGGYRLTEEEIVVAAEAYMREGYKDEAIARALGKSMSHIRNVRRDRLYREAAQRTGVAELEIPKPVRLHLAGIQHDEPFKAAVEAVAKAKPAAKDVGALVDRIENTRSDAEALAVVQETSSKWGPVTGAPPNSAKSVSRTRGKQALASIRKLLELAEAQPDEVVLPDDTEARELWQRLSTVVSQVLAHYVKP
jgi:ParB-like chromosome segregation protein Spo0J